jgi:hypothetical protein
MDPSKMTPRERNNEIVAILAQGLRRLKPVDLVAERPKYEQQILSESARN